LHKYLATNNELVEANQTTTKVIDELNSTKENLTKASNELQETKKDLEGAKSTIKTLVEKLSKTEQEVNQDVCDPYNNTDNTQRQLQQCFQTIEKLTNVIAKNFMIAKNLHKNRQTLLEHHRIPRTFKRLLPLLDENVYKRYVNKEKAAQFEYIEAIECNGHHYEFQQLNMAIRIANQPLMSYEERMMCLLDSMIEGELYGTHTEVYFKLRCAHNKSKKLYVFHRSDIKSLQNNHDPSFKLVFGNDHFTALDNGNLLQLYIEIDHFDNAKSSFLIHRTTQNLEKRELRCYYNNSMEWTEFTTSEGYVLFGLVKKVYNIIT